MNAPFYSMRPIPPFGVPQILSQAFWGGIWGIVFALAVPRLPAPLDGVWGWVLARLIVAHQRSPGSSWRHSGPPLGWRMPGLVI